MFSQYTPLRHPPPEESPEAPPSATMLNFLPPLRTGYWTQEFCDPTVTGSPSWKMEPLNDVNSFDYHLGGAVAKVLPCPPPYSRATSWN